MRYELRAVGVFDNVAGKTVLPQTPAWDAYLAWFAAGNAPDPMPVPAVIPPSVAEIAAQAEIDARAAIAEALKVNPLVQGLVARTPADVDVWIQTNVVDLNSAKVVLRVLAYVVALLARERLH